MTIGGIRFSVMSSGNVVKFNGVQATVVSATATQIVATVPAGATTGPITVMTPDGFGTSQTSFTVTRSLGGSIQGFPLTVVGNVTTVAGVAGFVGSTDGTGSAALFQKPFGLATDGTTLFITDQGNQTVRAMNIASGAVTTIAGSAGAAGFTDGAGSAARFNAPAGITIANGNLYICDSLNHTIRQMVIATGQVSTLAGSPGVAGAVDALAGPGSAARFNAPKGITTDGTFLYVADSSNNTIRRIDPTSGAVATLAGNSFFSGSVDGTGTAALFSNPVGITSDGVRLFITDQNNHTLRLLTLFDTSVVTIAGSATLGFGTADGPGFLARFYFPSGITTDGSLLYLNDSQNQTIRLFTPIAAGQFNSNGQVTTIAGSALGVGSADGTGSTARFNIPAGITTDGTSLFVADSANNTIRKIQ